MLRNNSNLFYFLISFALVLLIGDTILFYFILGKSVLYFSFIILFISITLYIIFKQNFFYKRNFSNVSFKDNNEVKNFNSKNVKNIVEKDFTLYNIILIIELIIIVFLIIKLIAKF